jgi:hypothetical protein
MFMKPLFFLIGAFALSAFAWAQTSSVVTSGNQKVQLAKVLARIEAIDPKNRILVVRTDRSVSAVQVDARVRNFDKLKPGQRVEIDVYSSVGNVVTTRSGEPVRTRYQSLPDPQIVRLRQVNTITDVISVSVENKTVLIRGPLGHLTEVEVQDVTVLHTLKPGTRIELDYIEGVAVDVKPL